MKYISILIYLSIVTYCHAQDNVIAWANTAKYQNENMKVDRPDVVFLGNSITEGWVNLMPEYFIQNNYVGRGISGQVSAQLLLRFKQDVLDLNPKKVVINIGTNDIAENAGRYSEEFTLGNIENMILIARAAKIKVILASVLPAKEFGWRKNVKDANSKIIQLNKGIKALSIKYKIPYIDYHSALQDAHGGLPLKYAEDGVHPNLTGYKIMAELANKAIKSKK